MAICIISSYYNGYSIIYYLKSSFMIYLLPLKDITLIFKPLFLRVYTIAITGCKSPIDPKIIKMMFYFSLIISNLNVFWFYLIFSFFKFIVYYCLIKLSINSCCNMFSPFIVEIISSSKLNCSILSFLFILL